MGLDIGEPVPYDATAVRPAYADLPATVRAEIAARVGGEPMRVDVAGGGFGGGFAARVTGPKCEFFVKATSPHNPYVLNACQVEARVNPALPEGVPAPRLRFSSEVDDWLVLGFEAAPGRAPRLPLSAAD
ncbi:MAG: aminoglycoside phosphotransferase family protein, partial [Stackebrandtia sp.]